MSDRRCAGCGGVYAPTAPNNRYCTPGCRPSAKAAPPGAASKGGHATATRKAAGTALRDYFGSPNDGTRYDAADLEYLKAVDELHKRVRFPHATDYLLVLRRLGWTPPPRPAQPRQDANGPADDSAAA